MILNRLLIAAALMLFSMTLTAQKTYLPLTDGTDTIGFFEGNAFDPYKKKYLFKSTQADKFVESHPDVDFEWSTNEMTYELQLKWNPFPNIISDIFDITATEVTTGKKFQLGTFKELSRTAIVDKEGSSQELYQLALDWVNETYKSPESVIKGKVEGQYLKINGSVSGLLAFPHKKQKVSKSTNLYQGRYTIEFQFKDGRFKVDIINLEYYVPPYQGMGNVWYPYSTTFRIKNGDGEKLENGWRNLSFANNYFNELIEGFKVYSGLVSSDSSNDDW
tara:strand:+ start:909 stop:1736 length:828 start_codon:yes stop_codon:yes gene_type:complete